MRPDAQHYLERLCDSTDTDPAPALRGGGVPALPYVGIEPYTVAESLRYSPWRTRAVLRELLRHHLVDLSVVVGEDGRNELRLIPNGETARWYGRVLRQRVAAARRAASGASPLAGR